MLQLIPSWVSYRQLRSRLRSKRSAIQLEYSQRALRFEQLEDRCVLAGGVIPTSVQAALAANLTPVLMNSLQSTSNLPVIGSALNDQAFVSSQVSQLIDQIDTASATPGAVSISVAPDLKTTFSVNTPLHSTGAKNIQISGNGLSPFNLSKVPKLNQNAYLSLWVDIWYRLSFTIDPSTGTTTFQDVALSGITPTVSTWSSSFGPGGPSWNLSSPAPNSPLSVVIMAATAPTFQADGAIQKLPTTITPHAASVIASGGQASLDDLTYLY